MARQPLPATAVAVGFIDCINRGDLNGLRQLMTFDHRLVVFDETPLAGRDANANAWRSYFDSFPEYVIYPHRISERDGVVAVVGHTTGSHLVLPDTVEAAMTLIWLAEIVDGLVSAWRLVEDTPAARKEYALD